MSERETILIVSLVLSFFVGWAGGCTVGALAVLWSWNRVDRREATGRGD
jgi:hypothetical protein